ncbi:uncharacterized protein JCM6883_001738 [Sporobolomyces salmoneus]|uniref:uncharacterized protein n=1 Tax=Sporobolomyces salmoneus TaxID=183962 RepID=UPI00316DC710
MRRRASQDFNQQHSFNQAFSPPPPRAASQATGVYGSPSLQPPQRGHSPVVDRGQYSTTTTTQRPALASQQMPSYHSNGGNDPYHQGSGGDHTDLYGFYANDDAHSASSHTALNMPYSEKDYYQNSAVPSLPPQPIHATPPSPYYPPSPNPGGYFSPGPHGHQQFVGGFGGYYENPNTQYAQLRQGVMKRREKKQVELTDGHLVLELPVARSLAQLGKGGSEEWESGKLRYTAVTEDPDDFTRSRYRLRQTISRRQTELAIILTMYNEDEVLFTRTFKSVIKNIQHLESRSRSKTWGADSWKKVVVVVVSDGRSKINNRTLKMLGLYGVYQDGVMKDTVEGKDTQAHVFEYTTNVVVDKDGQVKAGISPIQILFCLKETNKKKLNSHRWAFNAFCPQLQPNVCVLIDVGTKPASDSIYKLWKAFDKDKKVGGACGEITVDTGRGCMNLWNPLVAAQNFEYKMSNILDKPLESTFGFISVLPGAFSAYRYKALLGKPLEAYFLGEKMHAPGAIASLADSNMYLAEDRILCFEICAKKGERWVLRYVKTSASTDVPDSVAEFISQRRRWNNGAFFAALHASTHYYRLLTSGQSFLRKIWMSIIFLYNLIQLFFSFVGLSSFYLAFFFLCNAATADSADDPFGGHGQDVVSIANNVFICTIGVTIVCALGNKPSGSRWWYMFVIIVFGILFIIAAYCTVWTVYLQLRAIPDWSDYSALFGNSGFTDIVLALAATYGLYILSSILHLDPWHLLTSFLQYLLLVPSFIIVLTIYSFANTHDLAWGTKGDTTVKDLGKASKTKNEDGKEVLEVSLPTRPDDIDELWSSMRKELSAPRVEEKSKRSAEAKQADHYATVRTNTFYLGINMALVTFFTSKIWTNFLAARSTTDGPPVNYYQVALFWAVAGLAAFRFFGSTMYLILRLFGH